MSEIEYWMLKSVQENKVSRLDLAGDSRLQAARSSTRAKHARSWSVMLARALQDKVGLLSRGWILWLSQVTRPNREPALFWKTWRFTFQSHPSINTPYTHERKRASRENFKRENLEKDKIDSNLLMLWSSSGIREVRKEIGSAQPRWSKKLGGLRYTG